VKAVPRPAAPFLSPHSRMERFGVRAASGIPRDAAFANACLQLQIFVPTKYTKNTKIEILLFVSLLNLSTLSHTD
jgi:hypothetical protein